MPFRKLQRVVKKQPITAKVFNDLVDAINSLRPMQSDGSTKFSHTQDGVTITATPQITPTTDDSPPISLEATVTSANTISFTSGQLVIGASNTYSINAGFNIEVPADTDRYYYCYFSYAQPEFPLIASTGSTTYMAPDTVWYRKTLVSARIINEQATITKVFHHGDISDVNMWD